LTAVGQVVGTCERAEPVSGARKLRILFLIDEIEGITEGGTERQILQLIQLARRLNYEPRLAILRGSEWLLEERAGCPVYLAGARSLWQLSGWRACRELAVWMRREQITVVQTFFMESNIIGPLLARMAGVPVVIGSRRNLNQWQERPGWTRPFFRQLQRLANVPTDCIVGNSQVVTEAMTRVEGVSPHKMRIAYNGIDLKKFSGVEQQRVRARRILGVADDRILIGNISCMRLVKGLDQFVEAARIALEKDPNLQFMIVGDGVERPAIAERIRRHGLEEQIHLAGAQENVLPYLAAMDIGVLSSLAEGFSNSLLEYMASGLATVATDVGGNREALEDTGILVPPADPAALAQAILQLRSPELRRELGHAARRRVEQFSLERAERRMEEIYSELLIAKGHLQRIN
jgi:glycosyltransferase involved in cell wall biosynthesis